jgi:hypothetical protein
VPGRPGWRVNALLTSIRGSLTAAAVILHEDAITVNAAAASPDLNLPFPEIEHTHWLHALGGMADEEHVVGGIHLRIVI